VGPSQTLQRQRDRERKRERKREREREREGCGRGESERERERERLQEHGGLTLPGSAVGRSHLFHKPFAMKHKS